MCFHDSHLHFEDLFESGVMHLFTRINCFLEEPFEVRMPWCGGAGVNGEALTGLIWTVLGISSVSSNGM